MTLNENITQKINLNIKNKFDIDINYIPLKNIKINKIILFGSFSTLSKDLKILKDKNINYQYFVNKYFYNDTYEFDNSILDSFFKLDLQDKNKLYKLSGKFKDINEEYMETFCKLISPNLKELTCNSDFGFSKKNKEILLSNTKFNNLIKLKICDEQRSITKISLNNFSNLEHLDLSHNNMSLKFIFNEKCYRIKELILFSCIIKDDIMEYLSTINFNYLERLDLSQNPQICNEKIKYTHFF
jgi:hypothetical protein